MEQLEQLQEIIDAARVDAQKFFDSGNKAAGTRLRKHMQNIKSIAQDMRVMVSESNKTVKA
jgi:hypothetical protein